jgi:hypothetical protein
MINSLGSSQAGGVGGFQPPPPMNDETKQKVKDLLSQYDPENLSTDDMDSINQGLRDAGVRPSRELKSMLEDSGFDAKALGERARSQGGPGGPGGPGGGPPPGGPPPGGGPGGPGGAGGGQPPSNTQLQQLGSVLEQYDLNNLSDDDRTAIGQKLSELGFSQSRSTVSFTV